MRPRLSTPTLVGIFTAHWDATHDLDACVALVARAARLGAGKATTSQRAARRRPPRTLTQTDASCAVYRIALLHGLALEDLLGTDRSAAVVLARHHAMWALRTAYGLSFPEVARVFGGRSHGGVVAAVARVEADVGVDADLGARLLVAVRAGGNVDELAARRRVA